MDDKSKTLNVHLLSTPRENKTTFLIGNTGSGKTTLAYNLLLQCERFVVFDIKGEFQKRWLTVSNLEDFVTALNDGAFQIVVSPSDHASCDSLLDIVCLHLLDFQRVNNETLGPVMFYLDEANRFVCGNKTAPSYLSEIIQRGRYDQIEKMFSCQWFGQIPVWMRDSGSQYYIFAQQERASLQLLTARGISSELLINLPRHHCLWCRGNERSVIRLNAVAENQKPKIIGKGSSKCVSIGCLC